jgi:SAM-dependent methyltransferase
MSTTSDRLAFLAERRALSVHRFDTVHSPHYDHNWGAIDPVHADFVARLVGAVPTGGAVMDAACGTGKYWPALQAVDLDITGVDQSAGMLAQAGRKHPQVSTRVLALQDLGTAQELHGRFDGVLCVDALECVGPEDWPGVVQGLAAVLRHGAPAYLTVELPPEPLPEPVDPRQVPGEVIEGGFYHFYPTRRQVGDWLAAAGFVIAEQADHDEYWHLLLSRR